MDFRNLQRVSIPLMRKIYDHTMEGALCGYLDLKIHSTMKSQPSPKVVVVRGKFDRSSSFVSCNEKGGKRFNWKRPTLEPDGDA